MYSTYIHIYIYILVCCMSHGEFWGEIFVFMIIMRRLNYTKRRDNLFVVVIVVVIVIV